MMHTVEGLLRTQDARGQVENLVKEGKLYNAWLCRYATRPVIGQARQRISERLIRRANRKTAEGARRGQPGRILKLMEPQAQLARLLAQPPAAFRHRKRRLEARIRKLVSIMRWPDIGRYSAVLGVRARRRLLGEIAEHRTENAMIDVLRREVGRLGEQAEHDIDQLDIGAQMHSDRKGRGHRFTATNLHAIRWREDFSALLVCLRDFTSVGSSRWGDNGYGTRRMVSFRSFLVVRDSTTGEAHILAVPPKYGNPDTQFFRRQRDPIHSAVAWTFGLGPEEYRPDVER